MKHRVCVLNLTVGCWPLCLEGLAGVLSPRVTIVRKHLPLQLQCCKELEISHLWKIQCKKTVHVFLVNACARACVRALGGRTGCAGLLSLCFPVLRSTLCMNTPTPTSPFALSSIIQMVDKALVSTTQTFFAQERKKAKNAVRNYADNTCLTGRNTDALKCVNTLKLTIFHAL